MNEQEAMALLDNGREAIYARRQAKYEEACSQVPLGYLTAADVCRLFHDGPTADWRGRPATRAAELVAEQDLPLFEAGNGRWVVSHTVEARA